MCDIDTKNIRYQIISGEAPDLGLVAYRLRSGPGLCIQPASKISRGAKTGVLVCLIRGPASDRSRSRVAALCCKIG
jgi:hypothetical protein